MSWYLGVLKKYAQFSGRARRKEYWFFALFNFIVAIILGLIAVAIHTRVLSYLYSLAVLIPSLAVAIRRLHDTGRNGWWILIGLIPFVGDIILLVLFCFDSEPGENKYGSNPKK